MKKRLHTLSMSVALGYRNSASGLCQRHVIIRSFKTQVGQEEP